MAVYDIPEAQIDNTPFPNDACAKCLTPLYDEIYLTYNTINSPTAKAYCQVCMHSTYHQNGQIYLGEIRQEMTLTRLYHGSSVLARTKYPRSYNQVIDMVPNETIKEILRSMYSKKNTVITQHDFPTLLFTDCQANQTEFDTNIYVGFTALSHYFDYCYQKSSTQSVKPTRNQFMGLREQQIFERAVLYPIVFVSS